MLTNTKSKKRHRQAAQRPTAEQWEIIATIGFVIIIGVIGYFLVGTKKANAAVVARASVSAARPSSSFSASRSYTSSSARSSSVSSFRSTPTRTVSKPSTIRSVKPVSTPARPVPVASSTQPKKKKKTGFEYEYYAFNDCTPYSSINFQGWKCIDRD
ncbi:hypothetical protein [Acinetobacter nosocomialis]|uniref:hypothetical protein n=1 Tax=Acinetobacter nosocomialis TaxID=106654 RepID=UPI0033BFA4F4